MAKKLYGTDPDQVPTNADLGTMAYQDSANVVIDGGSARIDAARPASSNTARAELELYASGNAPTYIVNNSNRLAAGQHIAEFRGQWDGTAVARMVVAAGTDTTNKDDGVLSFWTASAGTLTKAAEFTSGGNLAFPNGQGIDFSASEGSGASSSVLDDYEEGTFTPTFVGSTGGSVTLSTSSDTYAYTKVGRVVTITGRVVVSGTPSLSGNLLLQGLPFTSANLLDEAGFSVQYGFITIGSSVTGNPIVVELAENKTEATLRLEDWNSAAGVLANNSRIQMSITYFTTA